MFKVRRGDAPASVPAVEFHNGQRPLGKGVEQDGFSSAQADVKHTLRDHDGRKANRAGIMATEHYDGDFGPKVPAGGALAGEGAAPSSMGAAPSGPSSMGASPSRPSSVPAPKGGAKY